MPRERRSRPTAPGNGAKNGPRARQNPLLGAEFYPGAIPIEALGVFLGVVGGIMTSILLTVQKSKCKKIKCCGCECDRDPTLAADKAKLAGKGGDDKP